MQAFSSYIGPPYFVLREEAVREEALLADVRPAEAFPAAGLEAALASGPLERWLAAEAVVFVLREVPGHSFLLLYSFITLKSFNDTESPANNTPKIKTRRNRAIRKEKTAQGTAHENTLGPPMPEVLDGWIRRPAMRTDSRGMYRRKRVRRKSTGMRRDLTFGATSLRTRERAEHRPAKRKKGRGVSPNSRS